MLALLSCAFRMDFWERQIVRANELAGQAAGADELLVFYVHLLRAQSQIHQFLQNRQDFAPSGEIERDLPMFRSTFPTIIKAVEDAGPKLLVDRARAIQTMTANDVDEMLLGYWYAPSDTDFFAKAFLQPYGHFLFVGGSRQQHQISETRCPCCGGVPQLSFLQNKETSAESGNRDLMCAKCLTVWPFRRMVCANCGEEQPSKLAYFQSPAISHVRVEACDTCKHYLKGVDLTRLGNAEPLVDEVAAAPLDLWAGEHGYTKIELNLVGL